MRLRGAWPAAEQEATRAATDLSDIRPAQAEAFNELGMIRLNLGDFDGANDAFHKAHSLGFSPMPGLALLALARGDSSGGWSMMESALSGTKDRLARAKLLPAAIEIALAVDHVDDARTFMTELGGTAEHYQSELLHTFSVQADGRIAVHERRYADAVGPLKEAVGELVAWGIPFEAARARCDLGRALFEQGSEALGNLEINEAKAVFARLGATAALADVAEMMDKGAAPEARQAVATMMFTDIVDSTKLVGLIGDEPWADLIGWHDRTIRGLLDKHGGHEIDHAGDGFFVSFPSAEAAVDCAAEIQNVLRRHRKESGFSPRVRIGIHVGEVLQSDEGLVGHEVHSAARVAGAAQGGEVLVSEAIATALGDSYQFDEMREIEAKGVSEPIAVRTLIREA
jgi:class 3 adenylate cyclase